MAVASLLGMVLGNPFHRGSGGPGGWIIVDEPEPHLSADIMVPDLAGWRRACMPEVPDTAAFDLAPDWVAEVLSPSAAALDCVEKLLTYARESVSSVWLVDPRLPTLEAFALAGDRYQVLGGWRGTKTALWARQGGTRALRHWQRFRPSHILVRHSGGAPHRC